MYRTLPISYYIIATLYQDIGLLVEDLSMLRRLAKEQEWGLNVDLADILLFKRQAIVIETNMGERTFATSNFVPYFMDLIDEDEIMARTTTRSAVLKIYSLRR